MGTAIEVTTSWGETCVLSVEHLSPPRDLDVLGHGVLRIRDGAVLVCVDEGAVCDALGAGRVEQRRTRGLVPLTVGASVVLRDGELVHRVRVVEGASFERGVRAPFSVFRAALGASVLVHALLVWAAVSQASAPEVGAVSLVALPRLASVVPLAATAQKRWKGPRQISPTPDGRSGGTGTRHAAREGAAGVVAARDARGRYAVHVQRPTEPALAREAGHADATAAGILGVLPQALRFDGPASPFGRDAAMDEQPSALGALMGDFTPASGGADGLGMIGRGRGGGGRGEGTIGLGRLHVLGRGDGALGGEGSGGAGAMSPSPLRGASGGMSSALRGRRSRLPMLHCGGCRPEVFGSLSRDAIRRVVVRHRAEVAYCYERALLRDPDLAGRVRVRFVIDASGAVPSSAVSESDVAPDVDACIADALRRWSFPASGGGITVVDYPFVLAPAGASR